MAPNSAVFNLSDLNGKNGFVINGIDEEDTSGSSVSNAGDVNGDGFDDVIIGALLADPNGLYNAGQSYVVFGKSSGFEANLNLSTLNGSNGFALNGTDKYSRSGFSVSNAGDVNGDGFDDLIIGETTHGENYVVFGSNSGFGASLNLSSLNGSNGFVINGIINSIVGSGYLNDFVSSAGDINGDGFDDLIIGKPYTDPNGQVLAGESYVVFGKSSGFGASLNLSTLNGSNGFVINGMKMGEFLGYSVSNAGDVNCDGFDDLIINTQTAKSYVVFGKSGGFGASLNLSTLNGSNGFVINGPVISVSNAGDVNGDGFDDLILGASSASPDSTESKFEAGESYVLFGKSNFAANFNLSSLDGSNGFAIDGIDEYDGAGGSVSSAGDFNGDGFDDLIIGAIFADPNGHFTAGESYIVFGNSSGFGVRLNLSDLNGSNGFAINGIKELDKSGSSVSYAGDINGDGFDDLIIGAPNANRKNDQSLFGKGQSYVIFGFATTKAPNHPPVAVADTATTKKNTSIKILTSTILVNDIDIDGDTLSITGISGITNGTAVLKNNGTPNNSADDFILFTPTTGFIGAASFDYTISDRQLTDAASVTIQIGDRLFGGNGNDVLHGTPGDDYIDGGNGNDLLSGGLGSDILTGGKGKDEFVYNLGDGVDTITDFSGIGKGSKLSAAIVAEVDTLKFQGSGLTARNLLLTENSNNLEIAFEGVTGEKIILQNFALEKVDNLSAVGNILFNGQSKISDSFDVFNANSTQSTIFNKNTVTFLNDLNNHVNGFDNSSDVINGQGGDDRINGKSGNDLLRGGAGNDNLIGGTGDDILVGGTGNDTLTGGSGNDQFIYQSLSDISDTITDFCKGADLIGLSGGLTFNQLSFAGNKIIVTATDEILATLTGINTTTLTVANFTIV
ncbi:MAG: Ig-like domain-containing protein [Nostoc sp.]|uniref:Ig-like domain-containing protein n=1 Tax=Nostoc sp. TaxID=1180 RepID=UPI002FFB372B